MSEPFEHSTAPKVSAWPASEHSECSWVNTSGEQLSGGIFSRNRRKVNLSNIPAATGPDACVMRGMDGCVCSVHVGGETPHLKKTHKKPSSRKPALAASIIDAWLAERCIWGEAAPQGQTLAADLFADFRAWRRARRGRAMSQAAFGRGLRERGIGSFKAARDGRIMRFPIQLKAPCADTVSGPSYGMGAFARPRADAVGEPGGAGATIEASIIDAWLSERCIWGEAALKGRTPAGDLWGDFLAWGRGRSLAPVTQTAFGRHLRARGIRGAKTGAGGRVVRWPIQLKAAGLARLAGPGLDPRELSKARRLAAMPAADVFAAFQTRAG